jgi:hypothetical protein
MVVIPLHLTAVNVICTVDPGIKPKKSGNRVNVTL